eukprot:2493694-Pyramimonas_sp.AAC.1
MAAGPANIGPPFWYSCCRSECFKRVTKRIVGSTHRTTWARRTFQSFSELPNDKKRSSDGD